MRLIGKQNDYIPVNSDKQNLIVTQISGKYPGKLLKLSSNAQEQEYDTLLDGRRVIELNDKFITFEHSQREPISVAGNTYSIGTTLGKGRFGEVCLIQDKKTSKLFAMKRPWPGSPENFASIKKEIDNLKLLAELNPPTSILLPKSYDEDQGLIIYKLAGSQSFYLGACNLDQIVTGIADLTEALVFLHSHNLFHYDIKDDNIMFTDMGMAFCDFGTLSKDIIKGHNTAYKIDEISSGKTEVFALGYALFRIFGFIACIRSSEGNKINEKCRLAVLTSNTSQKNKRQITLAETELLRYGLYSIAHFSNQRHIINRLYRTINGMLCLDKKHRPDPNQLKNTMNNLKQELKYL